MTPYLQTAGWALIHFIWQGAAIAGAASALLTLTRYRSSSVRYLIASASLLAMLAAPCRDRTPDVGRHHRDAGQRRRECQRSGRGCATRDSRDTGNRCPKRAARPFRRLGDWCPRASPSVRSNLSSRASPSRGSSASSCCSRGWPAAGGASGGSITFALATRSSRWQTCCRRLAYRLGLPAAAHVVESALVDVPTVVGWLRPGDHPANRRARLVDAGAGRSHPRARARAHPAARLRRQRAADDRRDAAVLSPRRCGGSRSASASNASTAATTSRWRSAAIRLGYAQALAELETWRTSSTTMAMAATGGSLLDRVRRILHVADHRRAALAELGRHTRADDRSSPSAPAPCSRCRGAPLSTRTRAPPRRPPRPRRLPAAGAHRAGPGGTRA